MTQTNRTDDDRPATRIEAYGVKGMKSTSWRRTFKNADAMNAWVEKTGAQVLGTRDAGA